MAKAKTTKIIITILIVLVIVYIIYATRQNKAKKGGGEWHWFEWGGSQGGGTEVLLCCSNDIQSLLQIGDEVEIEVDACSEYRNYIAKTSGHICESKPCMCRGDLSGIHEVVGFGDDASDIYSTGQYSGFRIKTAWQGSSSPTPDIISGKWRKVAKSTWF
tara:strand:+ start:20 stop:499 length:480 start_codon:yes stop_codon:yes gene_type:complete